MSTTITLAFEAYLAAQTAAQQPVVLDEFVFANVPGQDPEAPIDPAEGIPQTHIVWRQDVDKAGVINSDTVVYSVLLGTEVGDFTFNWVGLINKSSGMLGMVTHIPPQDKYANADGNQGNALTRSFVMEYSGAQAATLVNVPAETWQIDFTARLGSMDEHDRVTNVDLYGPGAFFGDGFLVSVSAGAYTIQPGAGYVGGLRVSLDVAEPVTAATRPTKVWVDASWTGTAASVWNTQQIITVAPTLDNYVQDGVNHYVFAVAQINADGSVTDLRPKGTADGGQQAGQWLRKDQNLSDLDDASEARKNLGCGTAATHDVQESRDDTTPGRMLVNGGALALRSVAAGADREITDASGLPANSVSFCYADAAYSPGFNATILDVGGLHLDYRVQYAASYDDGGKQLKFRTLNADNGYWGGWTSVITNYGGSVSYLDGATYYQANPATWMGVGAFAEQYSNFAPFHIPYGRMTPQDISQYLPIIKGVSATQGYGYGAAVSFGILRSGKADFGSAIVQVIGDSGDGAIYSFDANGTFNAPGQLYSGGIIGAAGDIYAGGNLHAGEAIYGTNGDITGSVWGGWLSAWLTNNVVHDIRFGAIGSQPTRDAWATSLVPAGCAQAGIKSNYNDSNWEVDTLYYWPLQKFMGGSWWNVGSGVGFLSAGSLQPTDIPVPVVSLTRFSDPRPYRDEQTPDDTRGMGVDGVIVDYVDSNGYLWSKAQKLMTGNVFISYDPTGVIRHISEDATKLRLEGLSVAGLDSLPEGCSIDGTWKFDGDSIYRDSDIVDSKALALNKARLTNRTLKAAAAIALIQASEAIGNPRKGDAENLLLIQKYMDSLRDVDIKAAEAGWPEIPAILR